MQLTENQKNISIIENVKNKLSTHDVNLIADKPIGLHSGLGGIVLFWGSLYFVTGNEQYRENAVFVLTHIFERINNSRDATYFSFSDGLTGIGWLINHLVKIGVLDEQHKSPFKDIDNCIYQHMKECVNLYNYEFLYGASGIILYFLSQKDNQFVDLFFEYFIKKIHEKGIMENRNAKKWASFNTTSKTIEFNISLSHGMSGLLIVLNKLKECSIYKDILEEDINAGIKYIFSQKQQEYEGSLYPYLSIESQVERQKSRLAWCYGDLGIAVMLNNIGKNNNKKELLSEVQRILSFCNKRKSEETSLCNRATFCHGSSGIYYILKKFKHHFGYIQLEQATIDYWSLTTLEMILNSDNSVKDSVFDRDKYNCGILEGLSGIGLVAISAIYNYYEWDECLLLN